MKLDNEIILRIKLFVPVGLLIFILAWAIIISPFTSYRDNWATYPVLVTALIIVSWHIYLIVSPGTISRWKLMIYGLVNLSVFSYAALWAMMKISKESI
jgi:hypothetical protein